MLFLPPERATPVPAPLSIRDPFVMQVRGRPGHSKRSQRSSSMPPASGGGLPPTVVFPGGVSPASDPTIVAQAAAAELIYVQPLEFLQGVAVPPSALRAVAEVGSVLVEFDGGELSGTVSK